jgi:putative transposase
MERSHTVNLTLSRIDPTRLVFIDETWTKTNMAPLRGWSPCGQRLTAKVPHGRWTTMTFLAGDCQESCV